ncbi:MAG: hypothetical protein WCA35_25155 [Kovacikia sp.]
MYKVMRRVQAFWGTTLLALVSLPFGARVVAQVPSISPATGEGFPAQASYPSCQPPNPGEYLLLVVSKTPEVQDQVKRTLPPSTPSTVCTYIDSVVTRVSGFSNVDTANAWARYLSDSVGVSAFVARSSEVASRQEAPPFPAPAIPPAQTIPAAKPAQPPKTPVPTATSSSRNPNGFNPKPLGAGYAVLVNYFNRPDLATQIRQLLSKEIGLVSYGQRPYLLATYTTDQNQAHVTLQKLTDRGFWAVVVDSRQVLLLRQAVK